MCGFEMAVSLQKQPTFLAAHGNCRKVRKMKACEIYALVGIDVEWTQSPQEVGGAEDQECFE